ncbi:MAG: ABC transporter substrate-binding protein [Rhodothermales bacterium]
MRRYTEPFHQLKVIGLCACMVVVWAGSRHPVGPPGEDASPTPPGSTSSFNSTRGDSVKIGLLVPREKASATIGLAAKRGAEMAISDANRDGGFEGRPFSLIVRSDDGPWEAGTGEMAKLVFEDRVWAILGGLDGRRAHLAEQIATKGRITLVSPWASDPTLTQINIPWFFRCVPDDRQQATALVKEIFQNRGLERLVTVHEDTYDARMAETTFARIAATTGYSLVNQITLGRPDRDLQEVLNLIERAGVEGIVLFGQPTNMASLVRQMRVRGMDQAIFGPLSFVEDDFLAEANEHDAFFVAPGHWHTSQGTSFRQSYQKKYGEPPPAVAAYAYDGMRVIVEAIRQAGLDREKIREATATMEYPHGVTGPIRFDARGNRLTPVAVVEMSNKR